MDLRPQAHDIIRTWLFATVTRSHLEFGRLPWSHAAISGFVKDPKAEKMSKSKGNVVTPEGLLAQYGTDGVRYWACSGRPGTDTIFDEGMMKIGRRLATKILNASRFALGFGEDVPSTAIIEPLDRAMLASLASVVDEATAAFEGYEYSRALETAEASFWNWTDDYLELVKARAYGQGEAAASAHAALQLSLSVYLRLFAPFLPFVTEEVWSWWQDHSVHRAPWPSEPELAPGAGDHQVLGDTSKVLTAVRRAKSDAKLSMRAEVDVVTVRGPAELLRRLRQAEDDLKAASRASEVAYVEGKFAVEVAIAEVTS